MPKQKVYKIGELARELSLTVEAIRYYERERLMPSAARTAGNYRLYTEQHRERLALVSNCRALDMTLEEIRALLRVKDAPAESCETANSLLDEHIAHVRDRITDLRRLERELRALRKACASVRPGRDCAILKDLSTKRIRNTKTTRGGHVVRSHHS